MIIQKLALILLILLISHSALAQQPTQSDDVKALKKEIEEIKKSQQEMQRDLAEIKNLLMGRAARDPRDVSFRLDEGQFIGDKSARVAVIEFSDFQCPFCGRFARETWPQIRNEYIKTGKIMYSFRDFPMVSIHPNAMKAASAAECAAEQDKYWEMHERLFANADSLSDSDLTRYAGELGLDASKFKDCMLSGKNQETIRKGMGDAIRAGVNGTPTFLVGTVDSEGNFKAATVINGAQPFQSFKQTLDSALASVK